ncbi:MAG TPA: hypothetical protein VE309_08080 [Caulobacteraceae bacterium]|nr:hypothetical protein [Caulobacteraceae bacterium]
MSPTLTRGPICCENDTHKDRRYLPLRDDIASVTYWRQTLPTAPFPALPDRDYLEVI